MTISPIDRAAIAGAAHTAMYQYGLVQRGWTFRFNTNKRRMGVCKFYTRRKGRIVTLNRIEISIYHILDGREAVMETIRHEIAHALVGPGHGHGPVWKSKAREVGCVPRACGPSEGLRVVREQAPNFIGTCPTCKGFIKRFRRSKGVHCIPCKDKLGFYSNLTRIVWTRAANTSP